MSPKIALLPFLGKAFNAYVMADLINSFIGNPVGKLIDRFTGKQTTTVKDSLGLNKKLLNMREGGGVPTRGGALRFLGDGSGRLDDAPDIVSTNQSVLNDIAKNQGLSLSTTVPPDIDERKILVDGFTGLAGIIEQINKNIGAIGNSLVETAAIEGTYRKQLMEDLEQSIADKGKKRSRTRFERSIFNLISRQQKKVMNVTGNVSKDLTNALLLSIGMEVLANTLENPPENPGKEIMDAKLEGAESSINALVDDGLDTGTAQILTELASPENVTGENTLEGLNTPFTTTIPGIDDNFQGNSLMYFLLNKDIEKKLNNKKKEIDQNNKVDFTPDNNEDKDLSKSISVNTNVASLPLDSTSGITQIIDLRTAQNLAGGDTDSSTASTQLDTAIKDLDPSRGFSAYESFVRSV